MITRRCFIASTAASVFLPNFVFADDAILLRAQKVKLDILPNKPPTLLWGFNSATPGPLIRVRKGGRIKVRFQNSLDQPSSIHWHGIRIDNKMDGTVGLTQPKVNPKGEFFYDFIVPDAGTYWYHSHNRSWEQVARGLYGALVVEEQNPPLVDHDITAFVDDWRLNRKAVQLDDFENMHDLSHAGRMGNFAKVIFQGVTTPVKLNQRIRLRLINSATDRIFALQFSGLKGKIVAYDGMPLETLKSIDNLVLAPAQRADIIADITDEKVVVNFLTNDGLFELGSLPVTGSVSAKTQKKIIPLEVNSYKKPDLKNAAQVTLKMEGGAMSRRMMRGMMKGDFWTFNGSPGLMDKPLSRFKKGQTAVIKLVNDTQFAHGIHLHGHHFQQLDLGGLSSLRDTILVDANQTVNIACVFDNPGKWLLHCHMLAHQASGMKTWVEVI